MRLVILVFKCHCGLYGEKSLFSVGCMLCYDCYVRLYWFLNVVVNSMQSGYSLL